MIELLIGIVIGLFCLLGFILGVKTGQRVQKGEEVQMPSLNPLSTIEKYERKKEENKEQEIMKINLENIDNYTGDGIGQKEIPK